MTKYTIKKAFSKAFDYPIWKIEVDSINNCVAVEYRNPSSTEPYFSVFNLEGETILENYRPVEKEWTLAALQENKLILKSYGQDSPIQAGIKIIDIITKEEVCTHLQFVYQEIYKNYIQVNHRSIPSGLPYYIHIQTGSSSTSKPADLATIQQDISLPFVYENNLPAFMKKVDFEGDIWLQKIDEHFIWSYHRKNENSYDLFLALSTKNELIEEICVINNLSKLILQPYFKVNHNILILSSNKQDIASYLV